MEEVGVDVGEEDEADAFDADYDVFGFLHADHVSGVALEGTAGDSHVLVGFEIRFSEYFALGCVVGCQQSEKVD